MPIVSRIRQWASDRKNVAIALLLLSTTILAIPRILVVILDVREGRIAASSTIRIETVTMDQQYRRDLEVHFSKPIPIESSSLGDRLNDNIASIYPPVQGHWYWTGDHVIRFRASDVFPIDTTFHIEVFPRSLPLGRLTFTGRRIFVAATREFVVKGFDVHEEPIENRRNHISLVGTLSFSYPVSPNDLSEHLRLTDNSRLRGATIPVAVNGHLPSESISFRSSPIEKRIDEQELLLRVASGLTPEGERVSMSDEYVASILIGSRERLRIRYVDTTSGRENSQIDIRFSSRINPDIVQNHIEVSPTLNYQVIPKYNDISLVGKFQIGQTYELVMHEDLVAINGSSLDSEYRQTVLFDDLPPSLEFESEGDFLSAYGDRSVTIETINISDMSLRIDRVYRNNIFPLFSFFRHGGSISERLGDQIASENIAVANNPNTLVRTVVDLDRYIAGTEPGLYRVAFSSPDHYGTASRWLLITDLGIVAKSHGDGILVWVCSFASLDSISSARVTLLSNQQQVLASGWTDAAGMWNTGGLKQEFEDGRPYLLTVEKGGEYSFLLLDRHTISTASLDVSGSVVPKTGYQGFVYGERDIYRPGETWRGLAIVRDGRLRPPPVMPVLLRHRDPQGREVGMLRSDLDSDGSVELELDLPAYLRTGRHTLEMVVAESVIASHSFHVEEFVPDRIKVEVSTDSDDLHIAHAASFEVAGSYLFGSPANDLPVQSQVWLRPRVFAAGEYPDFVFHNSSRKLDPFEIMQDDGRLDDSGKRTLELNFPTVLNVPSSLEMVITSRVREAGGRGVTARKRVNVHPYSSYLGLRRTEQGYARPGREVPLEYVSVDHQGKPAPSGQIRVEFIRDRWNTVRRETSSGSIGYESVSQPETIKIETLPGGTTRGQFGVVPPTHGSYRVVVTDPDSGASSELSFNASGSGYSPWAVKHPARVELELNRTDYAIGTSAEVQIRAPFAGKLWLTVERDRVYYSKIVDLASNTATVTVPVLGECRPNAYVTATLVRSAEALPARGPGRAFGAVPIYVDHERKRLPVRIAAPDETRPRSPVAVEVFTRPNANVTVAGVDEGILQLIDQKVADPFGFFYRQRALQVRSHDIFSHLLPESSPVAGTSAVGGGRRSPPDLMSQAIRTAGIRRSTPVSFWSGMLRADASGRVIVSFDVPEFQGALRIMAVAHLEDEFGAAQHFTWVRSPLQLLPTVPRFLSFDESVEIPVTVRNETGRAGEFRLSVSAAGPLRIENESVMHLNVADGSEETVYFGAKSGQQRGRIGLELEVAGNGEEARASSAFPLRPDLPDRTVESTGTIEDPITVFGSRFQGAFREGSVIRQLNISPLPILRFSGQLRELLRYPYGCLEQTTSRVFPLVYFGSLARELDPDHFKERSSSEFVRAGVKRISGMQLPSGGFGLWPSSESIHEWGTIYATHFLVEARRAGHYVEDSLYDAAINYLAATSRLKVIDSEERIERLVYTLYVLARAGQPELGTMEVVGDQFIATLRPEGVALLAASYAAAGREDVLNEMVAALEDVDSIERQMGRNLNSTVRNRSILLLALLDASPLHPKIPDLVRKLAQDAENSSWWSTQESGFAFLALGQFFQRQQESPAYSGRVYAGDRQLGVFSNRSTVIPNLPSDSSIRIEMDPGYQPGSAFFSLTERGTPTDWAFGTRQEGLEVKRRFLTRDGEPADLRALQQGDLVLVETRARSLRDGVENVVVQSLLPSGLEIENPRLKTTETLDWMEDSEGNSVHSDFRDDRILAFTDLPFEEWVTIYSTLRAVTPGTFRLPPVQVEAMYDHAIGATGERGTIRIRTRR